MCRAGFIRGGLEAGEKTGAKAIAAVKTASKSISSVVSLFSFWLKPYEFNTLNKLSKVI